MYHAGAFGSGLWRRFGRATGGAFRGNGDAQRAGEAGSRALVVPSDVSDPASVQALFAKTKERFGRLDLLFNNAGIGAPPVLLEELTYEQWQSIVDVNLTQANSLCYLASP